MRRQYQQVFAAGLTLVSHSALCRAEDPMDVRSRELTSSNPTEEEPESFPCRCEYPGEGIYDANEPEMGDYVTKGKYLVLPGMHEGCHDLWFVCPGVDFLGLIPWGYKCSLIDDSNGGVRKLRELQADHGYLRHNDHEALTNERAFYTADGVNQNPFPEEFHHLVDEKKQEYYTVLPSDNEFCSSGGTRIRSGEMPTEGCAAKILSFTKAGDRRPLPAGTFVSNEWFPNLGVKITASSDGGPENMYPMVFDMRNRNANRVSKYKASQLGGHDELGNVLVALRPKGMVSPENDFGMLNFEFFEETHVSFITLLNVDSLCRVFVTQGDGGVTVFDVESAGRGGLRNVDIDLDDVLRLTVSFKNFAAVVSLDLCLNRLQDR